MSPQPVAVQVKNGAGLWNRDDTVCACCLPYAARACLYQHRVRSLVNGVAINEAAIVVLRHEANFLAFCLARHAHATLRRHRSYLWLSILAQGKAGVGQL